MTKIHPAWEITVHNSRTPTTTSESQGFDIDQNTHVYIYIVLCCNSIGNIDLLICLLKITHPVSAYLCTFDQMRNFRVSVQHKIM